jgi:Ca2+-binding RTX toxin-like protein
VIQGWDAASGAAVPGFPRATDDFQLVSQPAVARVGGSGPGAQALHGTGLYQLHAYGAGGLEPAGWPKFTGGWTQATPSVGDADGDGDLEVSVLTREGWSFLWDTGTDACGGSNDEWWTFHHDEFGSGNYGTDARPPGSPEALAAARAEDGSQTLTWKAPGDDWLCGDAEAFEVRLSPEPIEGPSDGTKLDGVGDDPAATGEGEMLDLSVAEVGSNRFAAVLYRDDAGNWGRLAQVELEGERTPPPPLPPLGDCERVLRGTAGDDQLRGTAAGERIVGSAGDDEISARGGNDCVTGGPGDDDVTAGPGDDDVRGNAGADSIRGAGGADTIRGNGSDDVIRGNGGEDVLRSGAGRDRVKGGAGNDQINVLGGGRDRVTCGGGRDKVKAGRADKVSRKTCERVKVR